MKLFFIALLVTVSGLLITKMLIDHHWGSIADRLASEAAVPVVKASPPSDKSDHADTAASASSGVPTTPPILKVTGPADSTPAHPHGWLQVQPTDDAANNAATDQATNQPIFPLAVARAAMDYVGLDPDAEAVWLTAINDPNMPAEARRSLIEGLTAAGFADPEHPSEDDLPLIEYRLDLIEKIRPAAMDNVDADAMDVAYKDLVDLDNKLSAPVPMAPETPAATDTPAAPEMVTTPP